MAEVRNPKRPSALAEFGRRGEPNFRQTKYYPGISVSVIKTNGKYEISELKYGKIQKYGDGYIDAEPVVKNGIPIHSHSVPPRGLGTEGWSKPDREHRLVERMDENKPGLWYRRTRQKDGSYKEEKFYDDGSKQNSSSKATNAAGVDEDVAPKKSGVWSDGTAAGPDYRPPVAKS